MTEEIMFFIFLFVLVIFGVGPIVMGVYDLIYNFIDRHFRCSAEDDEYE